MTAELAVRSICAIDGMATAVRRSIDKHFTPWCWSLTALTTTFVFFEAANRSFEMGRLNYPAIAAYYLAIVFFLLSRNLDGNFKFAINRLAQRNVIHFRAHEGAGRQRRFVRALGNERKVWEKVERSVERWAFFGAVVTSFAAVAPWTINFWIPKVEVALRAWQNGNIAATVIKLAHLGLHVLLLTSLSLLVGGRLGKIMYYCWRGARLHRITVPKSTLKLVFNPQPTHPDGMGGAKPLGEFYLYCATRIFYLLWVFVSALLVLLFYPWGDKLAVNMSIAIQFSGGFSAAVILYVVLLIWPLLTIRRQLDNAKKQQLLQVDVLSRELAEQLEAVQQSIEGDLKAGLRTGDEAPEPDAARLEAFRQAVDMRQEYIAKVEEMQTFPMSGQSWIRYAAGGLTVPFAIYLTWDKIIKLANDVLTHAP